MIDVLSKQDLIDTQCGHENWQYVKFIKSNGAVCVRMQCCRCGESLKEVRKEGHNVDKLPLFDEALRERWWAIRSYNFNREREERRSQWFAKYNEYLKSKQWHDIRLKVLERDKNLCQSCLKRKATQVHHISYTLYEQIGRSAAFELVAI